MEEKQTRFVKSSDNEFKKLVANAVPQSTKKSTKYAVNVFEDEESYEKSLGSVGLCRHNFEHNTISGASGIILIFLQHNAVFSENCEKCMQILPATPARMFKVDKSANILGTGYLRLVPSAFWYTRRPGYLVYCSWTCIMGGRIMAESDSPAVYLIGTGLGGGGVGWKCHFNPA